MLVNDIVNILHCVSRLLPAVCAGGAGSAGGAGGAEGAGGAGLAGIGTGQGRDVRDVHAKCNELFNCMVYRGAELHFIHQVVIIY